MKQLQKIFLQGFVTFLPIALTIYIFYAGISVVDSFLGNALRSVLPVYIPGLGFLLTILLILLLGLLLNNLIAGGVFQKIEHKMTRVPFINTIYKPLRDLMNLFSKRGEQGGMQTVALVEITESGIKALGLVTRDSFDDIPGISEQSQEKVAVYIPMSYGLGGFTLLVPKSRITPVDVPIEKAMSLAITGWVKVAKEDLEKKS